MLALGTAGRTEAAVYSTTDAAAILYTTNQTSFYTEPDAGIAPVSTVGAGIPIQVTGITSNGWYRVSIGGVFYTPGNQLVQAPTAPVYTPTEKLEKLEAAVTNNEETASIVKRGIEAHASCILLTGGTGTYQTMYQTVAAAMHAPLQDYEQATINGLMARQSGRNCKVEIQRVSTIAEENAVDAAVAQLVPQMNQGSTYDKVVRVHDFICKQIAYSDETVAGTADYKSAYDALASGQGVCTSYALLFQKFMDQMGVPCYVGTGIRNGAGHAWNVVNVDGQWYHVDCTWDDQSYGIIHKWCLAGAKTAGYSSLGEITLAANDYRP